MPPTAPDVPGLAELAALNGLLLSKYDAMSFRDLKGGAGRERW
jgi:hypothetical protein